MATMTKFSTAVTAPELKDYEAQKLPTYEAQEEKVNETYDAKQEADIAALQKAYDQSLLEYNASLAKIPGTYQKQANELSAEAERQRAAFNEYAAARGVNSGVGSQAQLAMNNQYQKNMTTIRASQANAVADAELEISKLKAGYQADVAAAVKENDYKRAAALLSEYQKAAQSVVDVAQAQADELYRAYQSQIANQQYTAEWERYQDEEGYARALERAETLAAIGDFSGYLALGYSQAEVNAMKNYYNAATYSGGYSSGRSSGGGSNYGNPNSLKLGDDGTTAMRNFADAYNSKVKSASDKITVPSSYAAKDAQVANRI